MRYVFYEAFQHMPNYQLHENLIKLSYFVVGTIYISE